MFRYTYIVITICMLIVMPCASADVMPYDRLWSSLIALQKTSSELDDSSKALLFASEFDGAISDPNISSSFGTTLTSSDLAALFGAANLTTFYTSRLAHIRIMEIALTELGRRGAATDIQYNNMYGAYIQMRMFDAASQLWSMHQQQLPRPPELETKNPLAPYQLVPDKHESKLTYEHIDIDSGPWIIVLSHPLCHFSQRAFAEIESDPELRPIFFEHAKLLVPPSRSLDIALVQDWNRTHPHLPMAYIFSKAQWPSLDSWGTPIFYFFKDGALVEKVEGWPAAGKKLELLRAAEAIGLAPP